MKHAPTGIDRFQQSFSLPLIAYDPVFDVRHRPSFFNFLPPITFIIAT